MAVLGREFEFGSATAAAEAVIEGGSALLLVTGATGMGKTAFAQEIIDRLPSIHLLAWVESRPEIGPWQQVQEKVTEFVLGRASRIGSGDLAMRRHLPEARLADQLRMATGESAQALVVDDADLLDRQDLRALGKLLTEPPVQRLLTVLTAGAGWAASQAAVEFLGLGRGSQAVHIPLGPLDDASSQRLVAAWGLGTMSETSVLDIVAAAGGNPRLARDLLLWSDEFYAAPLLLSADDGGPASLIHQVVAGAEHGGVLAALAVGRRPLTAAFIGAVVQQPTHLAAETLDRAAADGLLAVHQGEEPRYSFSHSAFARVARSLAGEATTMVLHRASARALLQAVDLPNDVRGVEAVWHLVEAGERGPRTAALCVDAARSASALGFADDAALVASWGLGSSPAPAERIELLRILGRSAADAGEPSLATWAFLRALSAAQDLDDDVTTAHVVADAVSHDPQSIDEFPRRVGTAQRALADGGDQHMAARSRLTAVLAEGRSAADPRGARADMAAAVVTARESADKAALVETLFASARLRFGPGQLDDVAAIGSELRELGALGAAPALTSLGYVAMTRGDRAGVEALAKEFDSLYGRQPAVQTALGALRTGLALLDFDVPATITNLRVHGLDRMMSVAEASALEWMSRHHTGQGLGLVSDPRQRPTASPEIVSMCTAAESLLRAELGDDTERRRISADTRRPSVVEVPEDVLWGGWLVTLSRVAVLNRDRRLCNAAADALEPYAGQLLTVGLTTPIGPAGWFAAGALHLVGRLDEALSSNHQAEMVSRSAGSNGWTARCLVQRANILRPRDADGALALLGQAQRLVDGLPYRRNTPELNTGHTSRREAAAVEVPPSRWLNDSGEKGVRAELARLSERQSTILQLAADGLSNAEVARQLHLSIATVERHAAAAYRLLGVRNRAQAVAIVGHHLHDEHGHSARTQAG